MANPLFGGNMPNTGTMGAQGTIPVANINPQTLNRIMNMIQRGADIKDVVVEFKRSGISPQLAEQALCAMFPQMKQLKRKMDAMKQSGMSQENIFVDFAKQANVDPKQITDTYDSLMRLMH